MSSGRVLSGHAIRGRHPPAIGSWDPRDARPPRGTRPGTRYPGGTALREYVPAPAVRPAGHAHEPGPAPRSGRRAQRGHVARPWGVSPGPRSQQHARCMTSPTSATCTRTALRARPAVPSAGTSPPPPAPMRPSGWAGRGRTRDHVRAPPKAPARGEGARVKSSGMPASMAHVKDPAVRTPSAERDWLRAPYGSANQRHLQPAANGSSAGRVGGDKAVRHLEPVECGERLTDSSTASRRSYSRIACFTLQWTRFSGVRPPRGLSR